MSEFNNQYKLELSTWSRVYYNRTTSELQIIAQNYTVEYENKKSSLMEFYRQKVKQEVTEINENERKEYSTAVQDMESKSAEEILSNIEQALHTHRQLCEKESRGLNAFLSSYFIKYIDTAEKNLEDYSNPSNKNATNEGL